MLDFLELYIREHEIGGTVYGEMLPDALREVFRTLENQGHSGLSWSIMMDLIPEINRAYDQYLKDKIAPNRS